MKDKILGVLYGMAIGDAFGMPPELWTRKRLQEHYGTISDFLDGHPQNEISFQYRKGEFTDDTAQSLVILDSLIESNFVPDSKNIGKHILAWAKKENAFEKNILGPTSKYMLESFERDENAKKFSDQALTNGAAMRIAPIGTLFLPNQKKQLCDFVAKVSAVTHTSDITITGACMIAIAVSSVLEFGDRNRMIEDVLLVEEYALSLGAETISASIGKRILYGIACIKKYGQDGNALLEDLYQMFGAGVNTIDSVPIAIILAYYAFDVKDCARLCANLGGDTDTIGAMATAICGAKGKSKICKDYIQVIDEANQVDFLYYANHLERYRGKL